MKSIRLALILMTSVSPLKAAPSQDAFSKKLLDVYARGDVEGFLSLVEIDESTPKEIRAQHREEFMHDAKKKILGVKFEALSGKENTSYERKGETFITTLTPVIKVVVSFDDPNERPKLISSTHLLGIKGDEYRIVSVRIAKKPYPTMPEPPR